eukprot:5658615-Prymnesium_polylepis.2
MLEHDAQKTGENVGESIKYNEVVLDGVMTNAHLPHAIEAVFHLETDLDGGAAARKMYSDFLATFPEVTPSEIPLLVLRRIPAGADAGTVDPFVLAGDEGSAATDTGPALVSEGVGPAATASASRRPPSPPPPPKEQWVNGVAPGALASGAQGVGSTGDISALGYGRARR